MFGEVLRGMLIKLKEASWVTLYIGVAEIVELISKSFLDCLAKFGIIFFPMLIELASAVFKLVGLSS